MSDEPVKVKMTLRAAKPTVGGTSPSPLAASVVESVEARCRKESEERSENKENRDGNRLRKLTTGCLARIVLLLAVVGGIWYFLGEKFLLPEYTFQKVWPQVQQLWK